MTVETETTGQAGTTALAAALARALRPGDVVALRGELGAGKTCFVRGLAEGLGLDPRAVSSPTFVICQTYEGDPGAVSLAHVDAYRLAGPAELETIGWDDLLASKRTVVAVEWADRIEAALPERRIDVRITHAGTEQRAIELTAHPALADRLQPLAATVPRPRTPATCRRCGRPVDPSSSSFPFCSSRCRLADLGQWFKGAYTISGPPDDGPGDEPA